MRRGRSSHGTCAAALLTLQLAALGAVLLRAARRAEVSRPVPTKNAGLKGRVPRPPHTVPHERRKLEEAPRKRKKKVRLYFPDSIFISWELLLGFVSDESLLCLLSSSSFLRALRGAGSSSVNASC